MELPTLFASDSYYSATDSALLRQSLLPEENPDEVAQLNDEEEAKDYSRIRCPLCRWQPDATCWWSCEDQAEPEYFFHGCGTAWNTFATRGLCPGCGYQWRWTMCLWCESWSLHADWYAQETD